MDCHRSAVLALGLAGLVLGCTPQKTIPLNPSGPTPPPPPAQVARVQPEPEPANLPKRQPKANTCVAAGNFRLQEMDSPKCTPTQHDSLAEQARKAFQQALALEPDNLQAHLGLARLYMKLNDHDRAVAAYQAGLKAHPKEGTLWFELGLCYSRQKQWDQALDSFRRASETDPGNRQYAQTLGHALARAGQIEESYACFEKVVGPAKAHYNVARMLLHMNQPDSARQQLKLALLTDPQMDAARQLLAQLDEKPDRPANSSGIVTIGFEEAAPEE